MATHTYRYCDGCDVPLDRPFKLKVGWFKPYGAEAIHEYDLCELCFHAHCDILHPKSWPRIPAKERT